MKKFIKKFVALSIVMGYAAPVIKAAEPLPAQKIATQNPPIKRILNHENFELKNKRNEHIFVPLQLEDATFFTQKASDKLLDFDRVQYRNKILKDVEESFPHLKKWAQQAHHLEYLLADYDEEKSINSFIKSFITWATSQAEISANGRDADMRKASNALQTLKTLVQNQRQKRLIELLGENQHATKLFKILLLDIKDKMCTGYKDSYISALEAITRASLFVSCYLLDYITQETAKRDRELMEDIDNYFLIPTEHR